MAVVNAYLPFNTLDPSLFYGNLIEASSTRIVVSDGSRTVVYEGSGLTYSGGHVVSGVLNGYAQYFNGQLGLEVYDFSLPASLVDSYLSQGDMRSVIEIALNGCDDVYGSTGSDRIAAYGGSDLIYANGGNDLILSGGGRDLVVLGAGDSYVDGGADLDFVHLAGQGGAYSFGIYGNEVDFNSSSSGISTTLTNVERVEFDNGVMAFDINGIAGQAYRLYQAAFDRAPDLEGLGYWIRELDAGLGDLAWMANNFIISDEFRDTYGTPSSVSNAAFLDLIYDNVLNRDPDAQGYAYWMAELERGFGRERVLASFSESVENQANVIGDIDQGIWYPDEPTVRAVRKVSKRKLMAGMPRRWP
jgi:hypothetical protein